MASQTVAPGQRIRELDGINQTISTALQNAGLAIQALSSTSLRDTDEDSKAGSNESDARREQFQEHTRAYYTGVQAAIAKLRRQAYALEEAGVISPEAPTFVTSSQQRQQMGSSVPGRATPASSPAQDIGRITNGGMGNLDVGWLNSRGDKVSAEKEAELVEEAKLLLEGLAAQRVEATGTAANA